MGLESFSRQVFFVLEACRTPMFFSSDTCLEFSTRCLSGPNSIFVATELSSCSSSPLFQLPACSSSPLAGCFAQTFAMPFDKVFGEYPEAASMSYRWADRQGCMVAPTEVR